MIFDNMQNYKRYENINISFKKAFEFLRREDLETLDIGRYEIDGDNIFALVQEYETKDLEGKKYEAHKKYIDLQYMMKGEENMGFSSLSSLTINKSYEEELDAMFLDGEKIFYKLRKDEFFIFFNEEPHMPGIKTNEGKAVKKIVIKIKV